VRELVASLLLKSHCFLCTLFGVLEDWTRMTDYEANNCYTHDPGSNQFEELTTRLCLQEVYLRAFQTDELSLMTKIWAEISILQFNNSVDTTYQDEYNCQA
jgi:hypothetical protein